MFMKAILHNKEDDLHFLLKCLVEEVENQHTIRKADDEDDDSFFDSKSNADDKLEETIFSEDSLQDLVEQDALKESKFDEIKEEDFVGEGKDAKQVKAKVMNKLTSGFYADAKQAIEAEQKKSPTPLTRQQREKVAFDLREKAYKKFISEGKPLHIKTSKLDFKWSVDEIKATWEEYTADRDNELRRQQYVKDRAELKTKKQLLNSFDSSKNEKTLKNSRDNITLALQQLIRIDKEFNSNYKKEIKMFGLTPIKSGKQDSQFFGAGLEPKRLAEKEKRFRIEVRKYEEALDSAVNKYNTFKSWYGEEVKRGMTKRHPKGTKEYTMIKEYFDALDVEDKKIGLAQLEKEDVAKIKDATKRAEKIEEIEKIIEDATEEKKKLHAGIDEKLPKDAEGNPIWVAEFKLTDEEKKEYQDRIKELETKTQKDEKFFKELQRSTKKVSPIQVMQADGELAGQAKQLKKLLEQQAVKDYLQGKKNPLEDKVLTAYMKGSYSEDKLKEFLRTDAKGGGESKLSSRDKAKGKRIPLGDGESLKREAYRRIYNYLELLTEKIKETTKSGNLKRKLKQLQDKMKEHNTKMFADLDTNKKSRATKYTSAAYRTLFQSLKEMKEISDKRNTSDNKRMVYAKKVLDNEKYGMTLMRDLMNIAMGQKLEKPPKKQKDDSKEPSEESKLQDEIKELKEKIDKFKNKKDKNMEEMKEYFNLQEELPKKMKELREKVEGMKGKVSGAKKEDRNYQGTPADLRSKRLRKAEEPFGEKTGLNAFRFFDVDMIQGQYVIIERETALDEKDNNYNKIKEFANKIKDILSDKKIMSAIEKTYSKLTGGVVFGQDKESADKRKEVSEALASLKPFISERRRIKKLLKPIPDFLVKELIADEEKLSKVFLNFLTTLDKMQIVDVSNILVDNNKLISDKNKVKGIGGNPYYNIFNKPIAVPLTYKDTKGIKSLFDYDEKLSEELIQSTKDEYSENTNSFLRDYWNVIIAKIKKDTDKLGSIYDMGKKEGAYAEQGKKKLDGTNIAREFQAIHNPSIKRKKAFDEFFLALDEKQDGKAFFREVEDLVESIIKLQTTYTTKKTKTSELNLNQIAKEYSIETIRRMDKVIDDKEITEPSQDTLSEEDSEKETERITAQLKPLQDKLEEMRKDDEADEQELSNLIQEIKKLKRKIDELKAKQTVKTTFGNKTYRFTSPIPISVDDGKTIIMGALQPIANQKMISSVEGIFETDIDDSILIQALEKQFLNYFKKNKEEVKEIIVEGKEIYDFQTAMLEQIEDEFEDLIKTFKSKNNVVDMSKVKINMDGSKLKELLVEETIGEELAKILDNDLADIYDSYVKNLTKVKERHEQNIKNAEKISQKLSLSFRPKTKRESEQIQTIPKKQGDEEE